MDYGHWAQAGPPARDSNCPSAAERGERWWPVALAIIVVACLHVALPARYRVQPAWVIPVVLLVLLAVLIIGDPGRIDRQKAWLRIVTGLVIGFIAAGEPAGRRPAGRGHPHQRQALRA